MSDTTTPTLPASREVEGRTVPAAGVWSIDPSHSSVGFMVKHLAVSKVRGHFETYSVDLTIGEDPAASSLSASIELASVTTRDEGRDGHLKSPDFFDVEAFPTMTYRSSAVRPGKGDDRWEVAGELTIHGVTKPVTLDVTFNGTTADPWGNDRAAFEAVAEIDREDFGLTWNQPLAAGGVLVGKKVKIQLEVEAVRQAQEAGA